MLFDEYCRNKLKEKETFKQNNNNVGNIQTEEILKKQKQMITNEELQKTFKTLSNGSPLLNAAEIGVANRIKHDWNHT